MIRTSLLGVVQFAPVMLKREFGTKDFSCWVADIIYFST